MFTMDVYCSLAGLQCVRQVHTVLVTDWYVQLGAKRSQNAHNSHELFMKDLFSYSAVIAQELLLCKPLCTLLIFKGGNDLSHTKITCLRKKSLLRISDHKM